jgi:HK97 family phage major capsid protein
MPRLPAVPLPDRTPVVTPEHSAHHPGEAPRRSLNATAPDTTCESPHERNGRALKRAPRRKTPPMTTKLLLQIREQVKNKVRERDTLVKERDVRQDEGDSLVAHVENEKRDMDSKEAARFREIGAQLREIDTKLDEIAPDLEALEERAAELEQYESAREKSAKAATEWADRAAHDEVVAAPARIRSEPRTYSPDAERQGRSFLADQAARQFTGDPVAAERLERHSREARLHEALGYEARDVGTGAFTGLVVPQYLTEMVAPAVAAMAPTVAITNKHPLTSTGLTVNISRITTASGVGAQSTEGDAATETNMDDTLLTVNVRTYTGMQDVSRQALERGQGVDSIITEDLTRQYWTTVNSAIINGDGTNGTHLGIRSTSNIQAITYADGTPTAAELYPKLANAISAIQAAVFMGATHFVMAPRRWWWLASQVGTSFPFLNVPAVNTVQAGNIGGTEYMANNRNILGVPVVVDGTIPLTLGTSTNEDVILAVTAPELHFWHDDGPLFIRAEQPLANTLQVRFVAYSYSAFTAGRYPGAQAVISSTGLVAPTF